MQDFAAQSPHQNSKPEQSDSQSFVENRGNFNFSSDQSVRNKRATFISILMGILMGFAIFAFLWSEEAFNNNIKLDQISRDQIDIAINSLSPESVGGLAEDVHKCRIPLGGIRVRTADGSEAQKLQVISGSYHSPEVIITSEPQRIPMPFPTPYETGRGSIELVGNFKNLLVWRVSGTWGVPLISNGSIPIGIQWTVKKIC